MAPLIPDAAAPQPQIPQTTTRPPSAGTAVTAPPVAPGVITTQPPEPKAVSGTAPRTPGVQVGSQRGAVGPAGPPGGNTIVPSSGKAARTLSGHRCVSPTPNGYDYAQPDLTEVGPFLLTSSAAEAHDDITVVALGEVTEPSWTWNPGPIYLAPDGVLTQTPPTSGLLVILARALSATAIVFDPQLPIALGA